MPANLASASPSLVLPNSLFTSFAETLSYPVLHQAGYHDLTHERFLIAYSGQFGESYTTDPSFVRALRSWTCVKRLTGAQYTLLRAFWVAVGGGSHPWFGYPDPREYDATGNSSAGRVTAVFEGGWSESRGPVMSDVPLSIREVA